MRRNIEQLASHVYDLVVVGAGIYGATIAWEAALRGLSVALLEKDDFGHATSANSLKTVHGGLRYLQHADIKRMRESIRERAVLLRIAPHLVHPLPCLMPTYGHLLRGAEAMRIALLLNDVVSFDRNWNTDAGRHLPNGHLIGKDECLRLLPGLSEDGLTGAAVWYDGQMYNSERLTLSFVLSAVEAGAHVANYAQVSEFLRDEKHITGVIVKDRLTGKTHPVQARMVVNAAGPWIDRVLDLLSLPRVQVGVQLAKAINVATRQLFTPYAVGLKSPRAFKDSDAVINPGGRLFFISPWRDQSLIGTTYAGYDDHPDDFAVTKADVQALLDEVNACYPSACLTLADVKFVYQGMVPITGVHEETGNVQRAKQYQIVDHRQDGLQGLLSVLGVKYTTARDVAEKVIDQVFAVWQEEAPPSCSATTPVYGGNIPHFEGFVEQVLQQQPYQLDEARLRPLLYNYGTAYENVLEFYAQSEGGPLAADHKLIRAEILHAVHCEMAQTLRDVILRRTEIGTGGYPGDKMVRFCADVMAQAMGWSESQILEECEDVQQAFALVAAPYAPAGIN